MILVCFFFFFPPISNHLFFCILFSLLFLDLDTGLSGGRYVVWYFQVFKNFLQFVMIHTVDFYQSQWSRIYIYSVWNKGSFVILWTFLCIILLWISNEKLTFSSPAVTVEFSKFSDILSAALQQYHLLEFEIAQLVLHHLHYLWWLWCFQRATWFHTSRWLAKGEWSPW